jgi:peroxiredoxin
MILIGLSLVFCCCSASTIESLVGLFSGEAAPAAGAAPDFTLQSLQGSSVTLSNLRGQVVVIDFWASWCDPCEESMPHLQEIHDQYADQGVVVLAINEEESRGVVAQFIEDEEYTFTVLLDSDGAVANQYGVWGIPHTVIVDQDGMPHEIPMGPLDAETEVIRLLNR